MANQQPSPMKSMAPHSGMRGEIGAKWSKLSAQEIADLKSTDDLVTQVQSKYQLDRPKAQKEVELFTKGRSL